MPRIRFASVRNAFAVRSITVLVLTVGFACIGLAAAPATQPAAPATTQPATAPVAVNAKNRAKLLAAVGQSVVVEGVVKDAAWSPSGKVLRIALDGTKDSHFLVVIFQASREKFDKAYSGDVARTLTGATVRVSGKLTLYRENPEIVVADESQLTLTQPATKPG